MPDLRGPLSPHDDQDEVAAPQLEKSVQDKLGAMLRQHFDDLASEPIPDQFLVLLAELEAKEQSGDK